MWHKTAVKLEATELPEAVTALHLEGPAGDSFGS